MDEIPALDNPHANQKKKFKQSTEKPVNQRNTQCNTQLPHKHSELSTVDFVSSTWILLTKNLCCTSLKTMKLWSRWPSNVEVPLEDMLPGPIESLLFGCLTYFWTQRFGSRMWTPRIKLADMLTKGRFTEWKPLLCWCNISLFSSQRCSEFSSQNCFEAVAKRQQEGDYDDRVVARSKSVRKLVPGSGAINDAIFDGIFKPGDIRIRKSRNQVWIKNGETQFQQSKIKIKPYSARPRNELPREGPGYQIESNTEVAHDTGAEPDLWKSYSLYKSPCAYYWKLGCWQWLGNDKRLRHYLPYNRFWLWRINGKKSTDSWIRRESGIHGVLIYAVEHWHEDDSIFKFFKINVSALNVFLNLSRQFQWR